MVGPSCCDFVTAVEPGVDGEEVGAFDSDDV